MPPADVLDPAGFHRRPQELLVHFQRCRRFLESQDGSSLKGMGEPIGNRP